MGTKYEIEPITEKDQVISVKMKGDKIFEFLIYEEVDVRLKVLNTGKVPDPRISIPLYQNMDVHPDDIFICAYMKCGTHWVWEMCQMLIKGKAEFHSHAKESCMMEFHIPEEFKDLERPRVFNTHFTPFCLPKKAVKRRCKFIILRRNPKDIVTSMYHHMIRTATNIDEDTKWSDFLHYTFENDRDVASNWFFYNKKWIEFIDTRDLEVLILNYEDIKSNTMNCLSNIAQFINFPRDDKLLNDIIEKCNVNSMREAETKRASGTALIDSEQVSSLYRKGVVGDWKEQFTVAENEEFDAFLRKYMKEEDLNFKYEL